jgi:DNA-binding response OmpR family regulator
MRILLVEDQPDAADILMKGLREQGYAVDVAADGEEADFKASVNPYDLIILDVMLPRKSGFDLCRDLRASGSQVSILMLTARDTVDDRIRGLDLGADDYIVKPFEYAELLARIRGLLRRRPTRRATLLSVGDLRIDAVAHKVERAGSPIERMKIRLHSRIGEAERAVPAIRSRVILATTSRRSAFRCRVPPLVKALRDGIMRPDPRRSI